MADETPQIATEARERQARTIRAQGAFLAAFAKCGMVKAAAIMAETSRENHYDWLKQDPEYAEQFQRVTNMVVQDWEDEVIRRGFIGIEKPVTIAGNRELIREFSDRLAEFVLKCRKPDVYGDRSRVEHSGEVGIKRLIGVDVDAI